MKAGLILTTSVDQALYVYRSKDRAVLRPWSNEDEQNDDEAKFCGQTDFI